MRLRALFADEGAVSPVIGVVLMVAITVVLAGVIGTFVFGLGNQMQSRVPQSNFAVSFTQNGTHDNVTVSHTGGDAIPAAELNVTVSKQAKFEKQGGGWTSLAKTRSFADLGYSGKVAAGDSLSIGQADLDGATVRVVWHDGGSDQSAVLRKWQGPSA